MDMRFTFVATGKKGAAHDMAVLREAFNSAEHFPHPPPGEQIFFYGIYSN